MEGGTLGAVLTLAGFFVLPREPGLCLRHIGLINPAVFSSQPHSVP